MNFAYIEKLNTKESQQSKYVYYICIYKNRFHVAIEIIDN